MKTYKKSYKDDIYFFIPFSSETSDITFEKLEKADKRNYTINETDISNLEFGDLYCSSLENHIKYECNNENFKGENLKRFYLGTFTLACYDDNYDGTVLTTENAHIFITAHKSTGIYIATIAIKDNNYNPSQLIDQMSTHHLDISNNANIYKSVEKYLLDEFELYVCGESKCVICLEKEPDNDLELPYLLSGETMTSSHINYRIRPEHLEKLTECKAIYDYYDSYISRSVIAFIFKEYSNEINVRMEMEASELFIVEIILFQNTSVLRTNRKVVKMLRQSQDIENEDIRDLYIEFGKTTPFWNTDIFKYPFSQAEANEVIKAFGTNEILEDYHRNQNFLDKMIEIKSNIDEQKSNKRMNDILFFLSFFESGSICLAAALWIFYFINSDNPSFSGEVKLRVITIGIIILITLCLYFSTRIKNSIKTFKNILKKNKPR